jgi:hypothetical protein
MFDRVRQYSTGRGLVFVPWLLLAVEDVFADALDDRDPTFRTSVSVGLWLAWISVMILLVLPGAVALVLTRTAVPVSVPATIWAAWTGDGSTAAGNVAMIAVAVIATVAVLLPHVGERFVDAASYGDERRYLLRPAAPVLVGLLVPTWAVAVLGLVSGPLALADERWGLGLGLVVVGVPVALFALRAMLRLAQRWLVFVPAGVVIHDHVAISEPALVRRNTISSIGPARAGSEAVDLTAQAAGLVLEFELSTPFEVGR